MKITKLLSILLLFILTQSCTKNYNHGIPATDTYYYLTAAQLSQTPYFTNPAFDTISYSSNKGDTLTFVKTKTDTTWYSERAFGNPDDPSKNYYQTLHNTYTTIKGSGSFDVKHIRKGNINFLSYSVSNIIAINFNGLYFVFAEIVIGDNTYKNFVGDLKIKDKTFTNSFFEYHNSNQTNNIRCYFSKSYGLVEIKDSIENKNWFLNN